MKVTAFGTVVSTVYPVPGGQNTLWWVGSASSVDKVWYIELFASLSHKWPRVLSGHWGGSICWHRQYNFRLSGVQVYPFKLMMIPSIKYRWYQNAWHWLVCYWNTDFRLPSFISLNAKEVKRFFSLLLLWFSLCLVFWILSLVPCKSIVSVYLHCKSVPAQIELLCILHLIALENPSFEVLTS